MKNNPQRNLPFFDRVKNSNPSATKHTLNEIFSTAMWAESLRTHEMIQLNRNYWVYPNQFISWNIPDTFLVPLYVCSKSMSCNDILSLAKNDDPKEFKELCYNVAAKL